MIAWILLSWFCLAFFGGLLLGAFFHAGLLGACFHAEMLGAFFHAEKGRPAICARQDVRQEERAA